MATLVLSAVGASLGGAIGGSALGLSSAVIGRAVGATFGRMIDQRIMGQGSDVVPSGRIDKFHLSHAGEGEAIARSFGRVRLGGQVVWASRFLETANTTGGSGKGTAHSRPTKSYAYSVSLALALSEGKVTRIGRIWADGQEVAKSDFNMRFYPGDEVQMPDPKVEAVEGAGMAPAFRGVSYVVFEDLDLGQFGNRIPQFSFEVFRRAQPSAGSSDAGATIKGVALIPGTGEYALATTPVHFEFAPGVNKSANINTPSGKTDFVTSIEDLREELGACKSVSLVVSWFGDDLRAGSCRLTPRVEQVQFDGVGMPWSVSGVARASAETVSQVDSRPVFGGTQADASIIEAISEIRGGAQEVMFYPFILMDIQTGNGLADPWSGAVDQPVIPWRGRITLSLAPGQAGSPDQSAAAEAEVGAFFGSAAVSDFVPGVNTVAYNGPAEWSYRRFILHYAHLCALAGGVESFCIGSELRSMTQIRGAGGSFPAVDAMIALAADVRAILGPDTKIGYAADWSEYFGYHPQDGSNDVLFNLDPLWADANIDFVGIDNYMPLSDWRDGENHADVAAGSIYAPGYLAGNVAGGEGYEWYYPNEAARAYQLREPIRDVAYGEDWVFRYKDIRGWWTNEHYERINGVRQASPTGWVPEGKPVWFTEYGCAAIDKASNQPNAFVDAKSSESQLPRFSNGLRDDDIQAAYLGTMHTYWVDARNNPVSAVYAAPMIDMDHAHVWAWDARPWPAFPARVDLWSDGLNYARGHWLNGRLGAQSLADVVAETCQKAGVGDLDTSELYGSVKGYVVQGVDTARSALQPLMMGFSVDAIEQDGLLRFKNRSARATREIGVDDLVWTGGEAGSLEAIRQPQAETSGRVRIGHIKADGSYEAGSAEAVFADEPSRGVSRSELPIVMSSGEALSTAERWLAESRTARDTVVLALPPSGMATGAGDVVAITGPAGRALYRVDRVEDRGARVLEAVRVEPSVYLPAQQSDMAASLTDFVPPVPVFPLFLDLPLLTGQEVPHEPHIAVTATPWPGSAALYSSTSDAGYVLNRLIARTSVIGVTQSALVRAASGRWDNGPGVEVKLVGGSISSASDEAVLNGANLMAIGSGADDVWEVFQFANATLTGADTYHLARLLRGQAGSEMAAGAQWPAGSYVVLLDGTPEQFDLSLSARNLARHYRVGPAGRGLQDASYMHEIRAFSGVGLRPYAPCHLREMLFPNGDRQFDWVRRTRLDGDSWESVEVPLGEATEAYLIRIFVGASMVSEYNSSSSGWLYSASRQVSDGVTAQYAVEIAQVSQTFGPGSFARIEING